MRVLKDDSSIYILRPEFFFDLVDDVKSNNLKLLPTVSSGFNPIINNFATELEMCTLSIRNKTQMF